MTIASSVASSTASSVAVPATNVQASASTGYVEADDYSVANGATVTLSFISTVLTGRVFADNYSVAESDPVVLEFV